MSDEFDAILDEAEKLTDREFASRISSLTRLKDDEINELCPSKVDKETLAKLMAIVNRTTTENEKKILLANNIESFAGIILRVLSKAI